MKHPAPILAFLLCATFVTGAAHAQGALSKPTPPLKMDADEPIMEKAIRRATAELADFLELAESPRPHLKDFAVRVTLLERNEVEYIWISDFSRGDNGLFTGVVEGDIHMKSRFKKGDKFTFVRGDIVDWTYTDTRKSRVHGAYTECALLTLAPPDDAERARRKIKLDCGN
jgi:uncharacterized protein YegJ (DUF2314 family)